MAYDRRSFAGGAASTTITANINASVLSISIASSTNWPTGSAGDFYVLVDRGTASEEKVRIDTRSGTTLTVLTGGRGGDGTTGIAHTAGATIELCLAAVDLDEANAHIADITLDHHTQYLNTARHDVNTRHTFGAAFDTPAAGADIATAAATGSAVGPSRADHVHKIGAGALNDPAMIAVGTITGDRLASSTIDTTRIANSAIQLSQMDANSVGTVKIVDAAVTRAKLAPVSVVVLGQSSAQSIASDVAFHDILWTTEVEDADGLHAASSATILPVFAGVWMFTFRVAMESTMGSGILRGMFNGQEIARGPDVQATGTGLTIGLGAVTFIRRCNGLTDLAKAQVLHDSAGSRNTSPTVCFAEAVYLGA